MNEKELEEYQINTHIQTKKKEGLISAKNISDGYHSFGELYDHRITLYITLCRVLANSNYREDSKYPENPVWRSKLHSDGTMFNDSFVLGISKDKGSQITYHLPISRWSETGFAETRINAPEYDGHTSEDVLNRLKEI